MQLNGNCSLTKRILLNESNRVNMERIKCKNQRLSKIIYSSILLKRAIKISLFQNTPIDYESNVTLIEMENRTALNVTNTRFAEEHN